MSRRLSQTAIETLTGVAVVVVAALILGVVYLAKDAGGGAGYEVNARLAKVDGLGVGTEVRVSGIKVGSVTALDLNPDNYLVTVHMMLRSDIKLSTDSSLMITSAGLLGTPYLSITPGGDDKMIVAGGFIENTQAATAADLMSLAGRMATGQGQ
jgi:phospholipid/cholesterol/gamma-HCH transport system substrate-binding protein